MIDEWSGFADLLANLIEKYASELDVENLPAPAVPLEDQDSAAAELLFTVGQNLSSGKLKKLFFV